MLFRSHIVIKMTASAGQINELEWMINYNLPNNDGIQLYGKQLLKTVVDTGQLDVIKWLINVYSNDIKFILSNNPGKFMYGATRFNHPAMLRFLINYYIPLGAAVSCRYPKEHNNNLLHIAAQFGLTDILRLLVLYIPECLH